ncbi:replicative DNA helicase [Elusimicrobiota bacterium]
MMQSQTYSKNSHKSPARQGPPHAAEAEKALLGSLLLDSEGMVKIEGVVTEKDFYEDVNCRIFSVIVRRFLDGRAVDLTTVHSELKGDALYQGAGAEAYLASLVDKVGSSAHIEEYARIVRESAVLRELLRVTVEISEECHKEDSRKSSDTTFGYDGGARSVLDRAEQKIFALSEDRSISGFISSKELVTPVMESLETLRKRKSHVTGVATGFKKLDELTSGFQKSDFIIVAGRPGQGKTAFVLNIAAHVANKLGQAVAIFSLEMEAKALFLRLLCYEARANSQLVRKGFLEKDRIVDLTNAASKYLDSADIFFNDSRTITPLEVRSQSRRLKSKLRKEGKELGLIIVDYLQLLRPLERRESRHLEVAEISRSLKALAKDLDVPMVAVSQLSRRTEEKGREGRPQLSDLRESGSLEQDADLVMFVYREEYYKPDDPKCHGKAEIIIGKQRNGPQGTVHLAFTKEFTRFDDISYRSDSDNSSMEDSTTFE